jgi:hypothetical protein
MTSCRVVVHNERAGLFRAGPFMDTTAYEVGARIQRGLLNGIRAAASRNFSANGVPDLFLVDVLRALSDAQRDLIAFVVFHGVDVPVDVFHGSTDNFPGRARLGIEVACLGRFGLFRDVAG